MKRIEAVDIAKAICIILVVAGHYIPENSPGWYVMLNKFIYSFHMPLFMFASGYLYMQTRKDESYGSFIRRKIKRLVVPYFSVSVLIVTIKLLSQNVANVEDPATWHSYIAILYSASAAEFLWFIWVLFIIFLIVPLFKTKTSRLMLFLAGMVFELLPVTLPALFCLPQLKEMLVFFLSGVILVDHKEIQRTALKMPAILVYILFVGLFSLGIIFRDLAILKAHTEWYYILVYKLIPYFGIFSICRLSISISHLTNRLKQLLLIVAANSFVIYLYHTTFMGFAKALLHAIPAFPDMRSQLVFSSFALTIIIIGVVCPLLLNKWCLQKNKILCFLFG
jgi:fucose 4-O-acetylase-like acetyltransferase